MAYRIQNYSKTLTIVVATDDDYIQDSARDFNGIVRGIVFVTPASTGGATYGVELKDAAGNIVFSKTGLAASTTHQIYTYDANNVLAFPLSGSYKVGVTSSGAQGVNRAFTVALLVER